METIKTNELNTKKKKKYWYYFFSSRLSKNLCMRNKFMDCYCFSIHFFFHFAYFTCTVVALPTCSHFLKMELCNFYYFEHKSLFTKIYNGKI